MNPQEAYKKKGTFIFPVGLLCILCISIVFLYSLFFQGESLISSSRGPWIDTGPPNWINWSTANIIHQALQAGHVPVWSDKIGIGTPLLADPHLSYFSPFSFILYLSPTSYGWDVMVIAKAILMLVFAYMFLVRLGMSPWLCAWFAALYTFSGHVFQFLHHFHTNTLLFAPLCLISILDIFDGYDRRGFLLMAIGLPLMIFGGGLLDVVLLAILTIFLSIAYLSIGIDTNTPPIKKRGNSAVKLCLAFSVAMMIAAVWILPYLELREVSIPPRPNRGAAHYGNLWYLFGLFIKNSMYTKLEYTHWFMKKIQYMHIIALPGFFVGVISMFTTRPRYRYLYVSLLVFLFLQLLKVYGFPAIQFIQDIPVLEDIRYEKYIGLYTLSFYTISAFGYHCIFINKTANGGKLLGVFTTVVIGLMASYCLIHGMKWNTNISIYLLVTLTPFLFYLIFLIQTSEFKYGKAIIIILATGVIIFQIGFDASIKYKKRIDLFKGNKLFAEALKASDTKRIFPMSYRSPRMWSAEGVNDVRDISVVHTKRYHRFFKRVIEKDKRFWHNFILSSESPDKVYLEGLRWLGVDLLVLSTKDLALLKRNSDSRWKNHGQYKKYHFIKLEDVDPLITIIDPKTVIYKKPEIDDLLESMQKGRRVVYLENLQTTQLSTDKTPVVSIKNVHREGTDLIFDVDSSTGCMLIVKQQYYPGWKAIVSGKETTIYPANYLFQAIPIPKGESRVELIYRPSSLFYGLLVTLTGFIALLMVLWRYGKYDSERS
jgi:hypothetical protein